MKITDIAPDVAAEIAEIVDPIAEDRWSEVKVRKPIKPKQTPIARQMDAQKRKLGRANRTP